MICLSKKKEMSKGIRKDNKICDFVIKSKSEQVPSDDRQHHGLWLTLYWIFFLLTGGSKNDDNWFPFSNCIIRNYNKAWMHPC